MDSYLENVQKDEGIDQDKLPEKLLDQLREFNIDEATVIAKQMLFKSIKQYDADFMDDVENYYKDHFNTIE